MKQLKEYKEIIHKCSKCGLCQSVCPIYLETGNECTVSRGQFIMLQGIIKGDLKMNGTINKYLDYCLKCGKCSDFCPSEIDIVEVILSAKAEYFKNSFEGKILSLLHSKPVFNTALNVARFLFGHQKKFKKTFDKKAVYFGGCIEAVYPKTSEYIKSLLNKMQIEVVDKKFNCCGLPFLTSGNIPRFIEQAEENAKKIKDIEFDYFVTDCASCQWAWKEYVKYVKDEELKSKLEKIQFKTIYDLIEESDIVFESKKPCTISYHKPCHEKNDSVENIIKKIRNSCYMELDNYDKCCGFAGLLKPKNWKVTGKITKSKKESIEKLKPDYLLTTCVGCLIVLRLIANCKTKRLISFLDKKCRIKNGKV